MSDIIFKKVDINNLDNYIDSICQIHKKAYSSSHLTSSFPLWLLHSYYNSLVKASAYSFVAMHNNKAEGFVISGNNFIDEMKEFQRKNFFKIVFFSFLRPVTFLYKSYFYIKSKFSMSKLNRNFENKVKYRLFSIAVMPSTQSSGLGSKMVNHLEETLIHMKIYEYGLSVKRSDKRAISFYERNSFLFEKSVEDNDFFIKNLEN